MDLAHLRRRISDIDIEIVHLFEERMKTAGMIGKYKLGKGLPIYDPNREKAVIERVKRNLKDKSLSCYAEEVIDTLMDVSKEYQLNNSNKPKTKVVYRNKERDNIEPVGYLGSPGSFSEEAACTFYGSHNKRVGFDTFSQLFYELSAGSVKSIVLPIENTSTGGVFEVYDLLREYKYYITGEICIPIEHTLSAIQTSTLSQIKKVYSHYQALEQCKDYIMAHKLETVPCDSTTQAAQIISHACDPSIGAIASKRASEIYNLKIIDRGINHNKNNYTRFVVVTKDFINSNDADKISVVFTLAHKPGTLYSAVKYFAENGLNLSKIESRPIIGRPWEYYFYVDFDGSIEDDNVKELFLKLKEDCSKLRLLGNYKSDSY